MATVGNPAAVGVPRRGSAGSIGNEMVEVVLFTLSCGRAWEGAEGAALATPCSIAAWGEDFERLCWEAAMEEARTHGCRP